MFPSDHALGSSRDIQDPTHPLYVMSHGAYAAGEQRHRHYDWETAGLNPATHSFGESASLSMASCTGKGRYNAIHSCKLNGGLLPTTCVLC